MNNQINKILITLVFTLVISIGFLTYKVMELKAEVTQISNRPQISANNTPDIVGQTIPKQYRVPKSKSIYPDKEHDPFKTPDNFHKRMNDIFFNEFGNLFYQDDFDSNVLGLNTDIQELKDKYLIKMDMPGMEKSNINIEVKNHQLFVTGERTNETEEKNNDNKYYKKERSYGSFSNVFPLPENAGEKNITVEYNNGVLSINIPKVQKTETKEEIQKITIS
ncbi:MAG: hypothetical protein ACD_79C01054G0002 [uncultured bacterium]|nr:MAG: hypothetical protein ACD_79C01054G0002 [uncultured bacterium]